MIHRGEFIGAVAAATLAGSFGASAATLDFTDKDTFANTSFTEDGNGLSSFSGTFNGVGYTLTPDDPDNDITFNNPYDGDEDITPPLAADGDGLGVRNGAADDEISEPQDFVEGITVDFDEDVTVDAAYFLDLFQNPNGVETEIAEVFTNEDPSVPAFTFPGEEPYTEGGSGFVTGEFGDGIQVSSLRFTPTAPASNDDEGIADFALAGLEIQEQPAPIPVPAGGLLLVTALGGLGLMRRRKA